MQTDEHSREPLILVLNSGASSLKFGLFRHAGNDESYLLSSRFRRARRSLHCRAVIWMQG